MLSVSSQAVYLVFGNTYRKSRPGWELLLPVCATDRDCPFWGDAAEILGSGKLSGLLRCGYSTFIDLGHQSPR